MHHNANNSEMPYFIKPSLPLTSVEKHEAYQQVLVALKAILENESNTTMKMATINCLLKTHIPYAYWVGFYCVNNNRLTVGPYQGTLGCLHIDFGKGVCGTVANSKKTKIVENTHQLIEGEDHITCDPNSWSEIVVPVFDKEKQLIAVLDVDSTLIGSFNEIDQHYLEQIIKEHFETSPLEKDL